MSDIPIVESETTPEPPAALSDVAEPVASGAEPTDAGTPEATEATKTSEVSEPTEDVVTSSAPGAPPQPQMDLAQVLGALTSLGDTVGRRLDRLETTFEREIRAESSREKVIDRLHAELQEYKQDVVLSMMRPVLVDLIQLHDDIGKILDNEPEGDEASSRMRGHLRAFQQGLEDILFRQGVEPYMADGETFDPRRQRAVATVPTDDPAAIKRIAARHRKGFQSGERVIRPEIVSVFARRA